MMHRHPFDPVAFIFGAIFVLVALLGLLDPDDRHYSQT
jgi:hypothetical protein